MKRFYLISNALFILSLFLTAQTPTTFNKKQIGNGGAGASMALDLSDFAITRAGQTLIMGSSCSVVRPCNVHFGILVYSFYAASTVKLNSGSGSAFIYLMPDGNVIVSTMLDVTCDRCFALSGPSISQGTQSGEQFFPPGSIPLWKVSATNGVWDSNGDDLRAFIGTTVVRPGTALLSIEANGEITLSVDTTRVGIRVAPPATSGDKCVTSSWAADLNFYYTCVAIDTWRRVSISSW